MQDLAACVTGAPPDEPVLAAATAERPANRERAADESIAGPGSTAENAEDAVQSGFLLARTEATTIAHRVVLAS